MPPESYLSGFNDLVPATLLLNGMQVLELLFSLALGCNDTIYKHTADYNAVLTCGPRPQFYWCLPYFKGVKLKPLECYLIVHGPSKKSAFFWLLAESISPALWLDCWKHEGIHSSLWPPCWFHREQLMQHLLHTTCSGLHCWSCMLYTDTHHKWMPPIILNGSSLLHS